MTGERGSRVTAEEKTGPGRGAGSEGHGSVQFPLMEMEERFWKNLSAIC